VQLNPELLPPQELGGSFWIAPDSSRVVFALYPEGALLSVPIQGGAAIQIGSELCASAVASTPDSTRVLFTASLAPGDDCTLYSAPIGGGRSVRIPSSLVTGLYPRVGSFEVTADGTSVVFHSDHAGLPGPSVRTHSGCTARRSPTARCGASLLRRAEMSVASPSTPTASGWSSESTAARCSRRPSGEASPGA